MCRSCSHNYNNILLQNKPKINENIKSFSKIITRTRSNNSLFLISEKNKKKSIILQERFKDLEDEKFMNSTIHSYLKKYPNPSFPFK